ncbi:unnamed protein product [Acanthoscelides obtectus]|uniref:Uncharacterized protein n=1 Tax=Acanthoscelides obtectus TaxID=200917 RepID=A0A9P0Q6U8_ACAOB|nr:unnamed protein product [Acanthoscelides obtectus]CAK1633628.1 hypothetical protein AOBTE_LOCUS8271 [Acanthoscelides obtectus]
MASRDGKTPNAEACLIPPAAQTQIHVNWGSSTGGNGNSSKIPMKVSVGCENFSQHKGVDFGCYHDHRKLEKPNMDLKNCKLKYLNIKKHIIITTTCGCKLISLSLISNTFPIHY